MSEDPVKYEPHQPDWPKTDSAGNDIPTPSEWFGDAKEPAERWHTVGATGYRLTEYGQAQIRIEALRAATSGSPEIDLAVAAEMNISITDLILIRTKAYAAYLESGE